MCDYNDYSGHIGKIVRRKNSCICQGTGTSPISMKNTGKWKSAINIEIELGLFGYIYILIHIIYFQSKHFLLCMVSLSADQILVRVASSVWDCNLVPDWSFIMCSE